MSPIKEQQVFFERFDQQAVAATLSGASTGFGVFMEATGLTEIIERVRGVHPDTLVVLVES